MAATSPTISFPSGAGTYFADSPVLVTIDGLAFPAESPFKVVCVQVSGEVTSTFRSEVANTSSVTFDISSALRAMWAEETFSEEVQAATSAHTDSGTHAAGRSHKGFSITAWTEYIDTEQDDNPFVQSAPSDPKTSYSLPGKASELERFLHPSNTSAVNAAGSMKPATGERIGPNSIRSTCSINGDGQYIEYTKSDGGNTVRDTDHNYVDFLFVNRHGCVETAAAQTLENMEVNVSVTVYSRSGTPSWNPNFSLNAIAGGVRCKWEMSSGYQTREWATWWAKDFLQARRWWMWSPDDQSYLPVVVEPSKKNVSIYDRAKQEMPHVDFTVTLALEG